MLAPRLVVMAFHTPRWSHLALCEPPSGLELAWVRWKVTSRPLTRMTMSLSSTIVAVLVRHISAPIYATVTVYRCGIKDATPI